MAASLSSTLLAAMTLGFTARSAPGDAGERLAEYMLAEHRPVHTRRQLLERVAGAGSAEDFMDVLFPSASREEELEDVIHRQLEKGLEDMPVVVPEGNLLRAVNLTQLLRELRREESEG